jgi:hypothetical protein
LEMDSNSYRTEDLEKNVASVCPSNPFLLLYREVVLNECLP